MLDRLPQALFSQTPPLRTSESLEREFDSLLAKIEAVRKQFDAQAVAEPHRDQQSPDPGTKAPTIARHPARLASLAIVATLLAPALLLAGKFAWADGGIGRDFHPPILDLRAPVSAPDMMAPAAPTFSKRKEARTKGPAVCVRLCDGFFFPSAASGGEAACATQCPDAPTALYTERGGSDRIDDAVSTNGAPYSALPAAYRYRTTLDNACTCHRSPPTSDASALALNDPTLRRGDVIMTPRGLVMFQGAKSRTASPSDFIAVSQAALPKARRAALIAMEGRGKPQPRSGADSLDASIAADSTQAAPLELQNRERN